MKAGFAFAACLLAACASVPVAPAAEYRGAPAVDYHQHLVSPAFATIIKQAERDGDALVAEMDAAGVDKAVVLSVGYSFGDERKAIPDADGATRAENDWTSAQVVAHPGRLIGFCSANPLRDAALGELERCLRLPGMRGIKQHLGNAGVSLRNPAHLARMQQVFALAERLRVPVLVHMRARGGTNYGAEDARIFIDQVLPTAQGIDIIVAHLGSAGPGYAQADEIMAVLAETAQGKDRRLRRLYVDVATNVTDKTTAEEGALIARRIRDFGPAHVLYGSDLTPPGGSIGAGWRIFREKLPLTEAEFQLIAGNRLAFTR